ncbi:hypothetical protein FACS1894132_11180 [Clostridia bacterium]|nr:hypothetical protein FACS1894132_11180 [Clostridia bacterium]
MYDNYLTHYGVLGMKWGVRRSQSTLDRLSGREKKLRAERAEIRSIKGAASNSYIRKSKDLYLTRGKLNLQKAKMNNDGTNKVLAKSQIKSAKYYKRHGMSGFVSSEIKKVAGSTLTGKEVEAIKIKEYNRNAIRQKTLILKRVLGPIAVGALSSVAIAEGKSYIMTGKFGIPFVGFDPNSKFGGWRRY